MNELFPLIGSVADDLCIVRSMHTDAINHDPAHCFINTGSSDPGPAQHGNLDHLWTRQRGGRTARLRRSDLARQGGQNQPIAARQWSSGFLPSRFQGVHLRSKGDAVLYLSSPPGVSARRTG